MKGLCTIAIAGFLVSSAAGCSSTSGSKSHVMKNATPPVEAAFIKPVASAPPESAASIALPAVIPEGPVVVFFDFNSDQLSAEGLKIIKQASVTYRINGYPALIVEGHSDRTGTDPYNEWLGSQRANSVKIALQDQGVEEKIISIKSYGNSRPSVVRNKGVREPQNRRVEIKVR
jgi:OmpA-OmpF porin, OOP family